MMSAGAGRGPGAPTMFYPSAWGHLEHRVRILSVVESFDLA